MTIEAGCSDKNVDKKEDWGDEKGRECKKENGEEGRGKQKRGNERKKETITFYMRQGLMEDLRSSEIMVWKCITIFLIGHNWSPVCLWFSV